MEINLEKQIGENPLMHVHIRAVETPANFVALKKSVDQKLFQLTLKRSFDFIVSLFLIILFSPFLLLLVLIIKLTSKGPVLFSNQRVGMGGKLFKCYKFRSMVTDHVWHKDHSHAVAHAEKGILHKHRNDSRITTIGRFMRRTSMDELPQLFNVLLGDMSIVGPRPLVPFMLKPYPEFSKIRNLVRPGITGLWQVKAREHNTSAQFMVEHDTEYVENYSFLLDIKILAETPRAVFSGKGAY